MSDQNKTTRKIEEAPKPGSASAVKPSGLKRLFSKRWVFPALYMAAAAIIVTILWINADQRGDKNAAVPGSAELSTNEPAAGKNSPDSLPAAADNETLRWPFADSKDIGVTMNFYNEKGTDAEKQAALIEYNNEFTPHTGLDFANKNDNTKSFDVLAAFTGKVTLAEQTPVNGNEVWIESPNGYTTVYQSLDALKVKVGDEVKQGQTIATAGRSEVEKDEGVHVHFEVRSTSDTTKTIDPNTLVPAQ